MPSVEESAGARKQVPALVGVAGWSYEDWKDVVYPAGERNKLGFLSQYLDCIEINVSFYRPVTQRMAEKWLQDIGDNERFRFTAKLWQRFTHETDSAFSDSEVRTYKEGLKPLADAGKLLAVLVQFPFYFRDSDTNRNLLSRIAESFPEYTKVLEVRDRSWAAPEALEFVKEHNYNIACLDMPLTGRSFRESALVTGPISYLRLHGRNREAWFSKDAARDERYNYLYSKGEMEQVFRRIEKMRRLAQTLAVIWNNHYRGKALVNACQSLFRLKGEKVKVPPLLKKAYPELEAIAQPESGQLF